MHDFRVNLTKQAFESGSYSTEMTRTAEELARSNPEELVLMLKNRTRIAKERAAEASALRAEVRSFVSFLHSTGFCDTRGGFDVHVNEFAGALWLSVVGQYLAAHSIVGQEVASKSGTPICWCWRGRSP